MTCYVSDEALTDAQKNWLSEDNDKIVLCDIEYYNTTLDSNTGQPIGLQLGHFSNYPYIMDPTDSYTYEWQDGTEEELTNVVYSDILYTIPAISSRIDTDVNVGTLEFLNADGTYDDYINYAWEGHLMKLYIGDPTWSRDEFIPFLEGINSLISSPRSDIMALSIRDKKEVFETKIQQTLITADYIRDLYTNNSPMFVDLATNNLASNSLGIKVTIPVNSTVSDIAILTHAAITQQYQFDISTAVNDFDAGILYVYPLLSDIFLPPKDSDSNPTGFEFGVGVDTKDIEIIVTTPDINGSLLGKYFHLYSSTSNYYVWYDVEFRYSITGSDIAFTNTGGTSFTITSEGVDEPTDLSGFVPYDEDSTNYPFQIRVTGDTENKGDFKVLSATADTITLDPTDTNVQGIITEVEGGIVTIERISLPAATDPNLIEIFSVPFKEDFLDSYLPDSIVDSPVPICLGEVFNIEPVLIDSFNHVYMIHEGPVSDIVAIRSNGVLLDESLYELATNLGCFRLLVHENNTKITCDVIGTTTRGKDVDGKNLEDRETEIREIGEEQDIDEYKNFNLTFALHSAPWLIEWIALEKSSLLYNDLCVNTFNSSCIRGLQSEDVLGVYIKDETDISAVLTDIMSSIGGYYRFGRICVLQLFQLINPENYDNFVTLYIKDDDIVEKGISLSSTEPPKESITLGYNKNWTVQDSSTLAGVVLDDPNDVGVGNVSLYSNEFSKVNANNNVLAAFPLAEITETIPTLITTVDPENIERGRLQATDEVNRRAELRSKKRYVYRIETTAGAFSIGVGDIINITHSRFGFTYGKNAIVISTREYPTKQRVDLEVWL